jgi:hypothetical protein
MAHSKRFPPATQLSATSFQAQQQRQRIGVHWRPAGFDRYQNTAALVNGMPVIGMDGEAGYPVDRFTPPSENYG